MMTVTSSSSRLNLQSVRNAYTAISGSRVVYESRYLSPPTKALANLVMSGNVLLSVLTMMSVVCYRMGEYWILLWGRDGKSLLVSPKLFYKDTDRSQPWLCLHFQRDPTLNYHWPRNEEPVDELYKTPILKLQKIHWHLTTLLFPGFSN